MSKTKNLCYYAVGVALYVALSLSIHIPLISHIQTDFGYVAFGVYLVLFGWSATIVGVLGCTMTSLILAGYFPVGWILGQTMIGLILGVFFKITKKSSKKFKVFMYPVVTAIAVFIGVAIIKTAVEASIWNIPIGIKFVKNFIAFISDSLTLILGVYIGDRLQKTMLDNAEK